MKTECKRYQTMYLVENDIKEMDQTPSRTSHIMKEQPKRGILRIAQHGLLDKKVLQLT